jgi:hypothetical protein
MKLVKEHINEFERGQDPYTIMGLGYEGRIKTWFEKFSPDTDYRIENDTTYVEHDGINLGLNHIVTDVPEGLIIDMDLDLYDCINIKELPARLKVFGDLCIVDCPLIKSFPIDLVVVGDLVMSQEQYITFKDYDFPVGVKYVEFV